MEGSNNPFNNALCLSVSLHKFGTSRKVRPELVETDADHKLLKISKKIFDSNAMQRIHEIDHGIRDYLSRFSIVNAMMKPGLYLVPLDHMTQMEDYLQQQNATRNYWVHQLGEEYEDSKREFESKLGSLYNEADYPSVERVKEKFSLEYEWLAMDVPAKLQYINNRIWQSEQEKAQARVQVVAERVEQILTAPLQELVDHLVERLTDSEDGKRKKFATNMLDKAKEFFDTFRARNLTGSEQLNEIAEQGQRLLSGIDLETLKDEVGVRNRVRDGFESLKSSMAAMITAAPRRAIRLEPEETDRHEVPQAPEVPGEAPAQSGLSDVLVDVPVQTEEEVEPSDAIPQPEPSIIYNEDYEADVEAMRAQDDEESYSMF
jgi:hypothetical protein